MSAPIKVDWYLAHDVPRIVITAGDRRTVLTGGEAEDVAESILQALREARAVADEERAAYRARKEVTP